MKRVAEPTPVTVVAPRRAVGSLPLVRLNSRGSASDVKNDVDLDAAANDLARHFVSRATADARAKADYAAHDRAHPEVARLTRALHAAIRAAGPPEAAAARSRAASTDDDLSTVAAT